ncbi:MAG: hypothetical protein Kow0047_27500 [Anaerolineae bacterium]
MAQDGLTVRLDRWAARIDRAVYWLAGHWLALINGIVGLFVGLAMAAPILMHVGWAGPARVLYWAYLPTCHQLPERSFFLFGERWVYSVEELEARGMATGLMLWQRRWFYGNDLAGYKIAICERDVAIYGSIVIAGLLYGLVRRWGQPKPLPVKIYLLFLVPIALDGMTQLVGLRESTWWLRVVTGALFGAASVWFGYPFVDRAMDDVRARAL